MEAPWRVSGVRHWVHEVGTPASAIPQPTGARTAPGALLHIAGGIFGDLVSAFWRRISPPANSALGPISVVISSAFWGASSVNEGAFSFRRRGVIQSKSPAGTP